jgi:predicted RNase H-like HicB family nuclease
MDDEQEHGRRLGRYRKARVARVSELRAGLSATVSLVSESLHLTIRYEDAGDGWVTAQVAEIPGAISQGASREEARANVIDALDVLLTPDEQLAGESNGGDSESVTLTVAP